MKCKYLVIVFRMEITEKKALHATVMWHFLSSRKGSIKVKTTTFISEKVFFSHFLLIYHYVVEYSPLINLTIWKFVLEIGEEDKKYLSENLRNCLEKFKIYNPWALSLVYTNSQQGWIALFRFHFMDNGLEVYTWGAGT